MIIVMISYYLIYRHLVKQSEAAMRLLPYGLYVGFHKIYYIGILVLFMLKLYDQGRGLRDIGNKSYDDVRSGNLWAMNQSVYLRLEGRKIEDDEGYFSLFYNIALISFITYQGYFLKVFTQITDHYADVISTKTLMKNPQLLVHFQNLRKVEQRDVEKFMPIRCCSCVCCMRTIIRVNDMNKD